jgi:hypothetical protein
VITTHALFALKVQRKLSNAIADLSRCRIISGSAENAAIRAPSQLCSDDQHPRENARLDLASGPELHILTAAAQTRTVSVAQLAP